MSSCSGPNGEALAKLESQKVSRRDAGELLRMSPARVQQLADELLH